MSNNLLTHALQYANRGWRVFPCRLDKKPATKNGFKNATVDQTSIRDWWIQSPDASIGIATGNGLVVIDLDGAEGIAAFESLLAEHGREMGQPLVVRTGSGGKHLYYTTDAEIKCRIKISGISIDVRGEGGYVIAPPSMHECGTQYEWLTESDHPGPLPDWLATFVQSYEMKHTESGIVLQPEASDDVERRAVAYLKMLPEAIQNQNGSASLMRAARAVVYGFNLGPDRGYEILQSHYNGRCQPPWSEKELHHKCADADAKPFDKPRGWLLISDQSEMCDVSQIGTVDIAPDLPYRPFPVDVLPEPVRGFVAECAKAIGCDPSYLALPLLTASGAAIGNTRRLQIKRGWDVPPILWSVIVGESGTAKTPAFELAMQAIHKRQRKAMKRHAENSMQHDADIAIWERAMVDWKRSGGTETPPQKPDPPQAERFIVQDTTVEALAPILLANPRGLLLARAELAGWFGSFDRYVGKRRSGSDSANWLSMYDAGTVTTDRKSGTPPTIYVPQAAVSVTGGIQPAVLQRALGQEHRESGLAARLLLAFPPRVTKCWTDADIDLCVVDQLDTLFDHLYRLLPTTNCDGEQEPTVIHLTADAKTAFKQYFNDHAVEQNELTGDMAAAWSKLEQYAARLALVIHFIRWAVGEVTDELQLDVTSMIAGIDLTKWFKHEAKRVYAMMDESETEQDHRQLVEWIGRRGGTVTPREVQQGCRWLKEPGSAELALSALVNAGYGSWQVVSSTVKGGRPTRAFVVRKATVNESPDGAQESTVCADSVDNPEQV